MVYHTTVLPVTDTDTTSQQPPVTPLNDGHDNAARSLVHFRKSSDPSRQQEGQYDAYTMPHPVWSEEELHSVEITHTPPEKPVDTVTADSTRTVLKLMHSPELWK